MYNKIFPSRTLDVASIVDPADLTQQSLTGVSHLCWLCCTAPGVVSCPTCAKEVFRVDDTVALCQECYEKSHTCRDHQTYPHGKVTMFSKMELLSVICIETSHYVCFTCCGDRWLFHDSMADIECVSGGTYYYGRSMFKLIIHTSIHKNLANYPLYDKYCYVPV